ncbi:MAG: PIG-L family deacetylase [Defluviitaleaceae bacterium]|nr:PIG-L family deacetylase [Defluviitaleaceae bacterium]
MANILAFSPHPDDVELVIGGLIKKMSKKHKVIVVCLTSGEGSCNDTGERIIELKKACEQLSVSEHVLLDFPDLRICRESFEQRESITKLIRHYKPQIIFSPHFSDLNPDHIESYWLLKYCRYFAGINLDFELGNPYYCKYMYFYKQNIAKEYNSFNVDVTDVYTNKLNAIYCYESQFGKNIKSSYLKNILLESIISKDRYNGSIFGVKYAEEIIFEGKLMINDLFDTINANY